MAGGGAVLVAALIGGWVAGRGGKRETKAVAPAIAAVTVPGPAAVTLPGTVRAKTVVRIPVPSDGTVERFLVDVGDDVFEGELLAKIKNGRLDAVARTAQGDLGRAQAKVSDLESALLAARLEASRARADAIRTKSELDRAEKVYARQSMLMKEGATARLTFEKAEADYKKLKADSESFGGLADGAEARIDSLTKELETAKGMVAVRSQEMDEAVADLGSGEVRCPVNGVVVGRKGDAGEPVSREIQDFFTIGTELDTLEMVVTGVALGGLKVGQAVGVVIAEAAGEIPGVVTQVKGGEAVVEFPGGSGQVKLGVTGIIRVK